MAEKNVEHDNRAPPRVENVPGAPGQTRIVETDDSARQGPKGTPSAVGSRGQPHSGGGGRRGSRAVGRKDVRSAPVTCLSNKLLSRAFAWIGINVGGSDERSDGPYEDR